MLSTFTTPRHPIRIVTFTTLYPNEAQPTHGVFVENRLRHLIASGAVTARVIAPIPWFPASLASVFKHHAHFARVAARETQFGVEITHPRFLALPKIGMTVAPALLYRSAVSAFHALRRESGDFDLIDAHYFYPDGVAAILVGKALGKPVVITARGTDINLIPRYALPRRMIQYAAREAAGVITVSRGLKRTLTQLGVEPQRIEVLRNGVDLDTFKPSDRKEARASLGLDEPTLLSVGALVPLKGHDLVIGALALLPRWRLLIVGDGPERAALGSLAEKAGVSSRVRFLGSVLHEQLAPIYSAADFLVLASSREGWPNVLLESMACGTPVIASNVGGNSEVVSGPEAGIVFRQRTAPAIAAAVESLFRSPPSRAATRRYAERFGWEETTQGQIRLFTQIVNEPAL